MLRLSLALPLLLPSLFFLGFGDALRLELLYEYELLPLLLPLRLRRPLSLRLALRLRPRLLLDEYE